MVVKCKESKWYLNRLSPIKSVVQKSTPIIEEHTDGIKTFITLPAAGYIHTAIESANAIDNARTYLIEQLFAFDYEGQMRKKQYFGIVPFGIENSQSQSHFDTHF